MVISEKFGGGGRGRRSAQFDEKAKSGYGTSKARFKLTNIKGQKKSISTLMMRMSRKGVITLSLLLWTVQPQAEHTARHTSTFISTEIQSA